VRNLARIDSDSIANVKSKAKRSSQVTSYRELSIIKANMETRLSTKAVFRTRMYFATYATNVAMHTRFSFPSIEN